MKIKYSVFKYQKQYTAKFVKYTNCSAGLQKQMTGK